LKEKKLILEYVKASQKNSKKESLKNLRKNKCWMFEGKDFNGRWE